MKSASVVLLCVKVILFCCPVDTRFAFLLDFNIEIFNIGTKLNHEHYLRKKPVAVIRSGPLGVEPLLGRTIIT